MKIDDIARNAWLETAEIVPHCDHYLHFARRLVAALAKQEPDAWMSEFNIDINTCKETMLRNGWRDGELTPLHNLAKFLAE